MKKTSFSLGLVLILLCLFLLFFPGSGENSPLGEFSLECFRVLFQKEEMREIFDLDQEEAIEVFGSEGGEVFL